MQLPPIHPAIVHFPIALIIVAFFADLIARITGRQSFRNFGFWSLLVALGTGVLTLIAGYADMVRLPLNAAGEDFVRLHMISGLTLAALLIVLTIWRWRIWKAQLPAVSRAFLGTGCLLLLLTLFQGWYGGEMVYSQGLGVAAAGKSPETATQAQKRLAAVTGFFTGKEYQTAIGSPASSESGRGASLERK
jgi:uncharacterized membrane protein